MSGRRWIDRNRPRLDAIRSVDFEDAVGADDRGWELAMPAPDHYVANGLCDGQTRGAARPSANRERACLRTGGIVGTGVHAAARGECQHEHTRRPSSHDSLYRSRGQVRQQREVSHLQKRANALGFALQPLVA